MTMVKPFITRTTAFLGTDAPELDPWGRKDVAKHGGGSHDDEDHGNWADGISPKEDPSGQQRIPDIENPRGDIETLLGFRDEGEWGEMADARGTNWSEFVDTVKGDWVQWQGCRDIRNAAAEIAGVNDTDKFEVVDPHADFSGNHRSMGAYGIPKREAQFLMEQLIDGEQFYDLYRAVGMLSRSDMEEFMQLAQSGETFDAPLLSFSNVHGIGENEILADYGTDILLHVEGRTTGYSDYDSQLTDPLWLQRDEDTWLRDTEITMLDHIDEVEEPQVYDDAVYLKEAIGDHLSGKRPLDQSDRLRIEDMWGGPEYSKWAGSKIDEAQNPDAYYEWFDYPPDGVPKEIISGGRFRVKSVEDGKGEFDAYQKVITVEQIGVFDPFNESELIMKLLRPGFWLDAPGLIPPEVTENRVRVEAERPEEDDTEEVVKHYGPGPHPSGSPQDVHGGPKRLPMDRLPGVDWSEYGIEHPEIPDRAFWDDWSPVMTPEEADEMLMAHGLDTIYAGAHATADPAAVLREGFQAEEFGTNMGQGWGKGVYMVHEGADDYYQTSLDYSTNGTSIRVAMGFENPLEVFAEDPSEDTWTAMQYSPGIGSTFHYDGPGVHPLDHYKIITEWAKIPWNPAWDEEKPWGIGASGDATEYRSSDAYPGLSKVLSDAGYDGLIINAPRDYPVEFYGHYSDVYLDEIGSLENIKYDPEWERAVYGDGEPAPGTGGSQVIAFDPQHTAIIGVTEFTDDGYAGSPDEDPEIVAALEAVSKTWVPEVTDDMVRRVYGPWLVKIGGDRRGPGSPPPGGRRLLKHYGPGDHESGSSQLKHGKKGSKGPAKASSPVDPKAAKKAEEQKRIAKIMERVKGVYEQDQRFIEMREAFYAEFSDDFGLTDLHDNDEIFGAANFIEDEQREWLEENYPDEYEALTLESPWEFWNRHANRRVFDVFAQAPYGIGFMSEAIMEMEDWLEKANPYIRVDSSAFEQILRDGEIKNQIETGSSNGWFDPAGRMEVDKILFGIDHEWDDIRESPIYGYLEREPLVWAEGEAPTAHAENLEHYGAIAIELDKDTSYTFTVGDSLDDSGVTSWGFGGAVMQSAESITGGQPGLTVGSPGYVMPSDLDGVLADIHPEGSMGVEGSTRYIEAQYHEEITFSDDVKAIHMPRYILEDLGFADEEEFGDYYGIPEHIEVNVYSP